MSERINAKCHTETAWFCHYPYRDWARVTLSLPDRLHKTTFFWEKVKFTLVQALRLCTGHTAHRGSRGIALLFLDHGTRRGWGVSVAPRPLFTPGKDPVPIVQEAGWAPRSIWTGAENLGPLGFDPRTVHPVASRYTDWAIAVHFSWRLEL